VYGTTAARATCLLFDDEPTAVNPSCRGYSSTVMVMG
jgi:hypothetical protein